MATGAFFVICRDQLHAPISLERGHIHDGAVSCPANGRDASGAGISSLMTGRRIVAESGFRSGEFVVNLGAGHGALTADLVAAGRSGPESRCREALSIIHRRWIRRCW
ncbi:Probable methyltransferase [Mycobacteroides abscessus]|nr:Probable methyltransferase [Mycobacteroides abscessus]